MQIIRSRTRQSGEDVLYADARESIKDCDILLYRGRSWESRLIRLVTGAPYSHAGLAVWWNDRLMVLEAVGRGVMVTPLSQNVARYDGRVEWFTPVEEIPPGERVRMVEFAQRELGKEYGTWQALLLGLRRLFGLAGSDDDTPRRARKLICSHYVASVYTLAGRDLTRGVSDMSTAPGDIARSPLLQRMGPLRKSAGRKRTLTFNVDGGRSVMSMLVLSAALLLPLTLPAQWSAQPSGVGCYFFSIDAVDDNVVWASGSAATVLRTTNGGLSWSRAGSLGDYWHATHICAASRESAWVVLAAPDGTSQYIVGRTTNAGTTWTVQVQNMDGWCEGIHRFGNGTLVALGGPSPFPSTQWEIWRSENNGGAWARLASTHYPPAESSAHEWMAYGSTCSTGDDVWFTTSHSGITTAHCRIFHSSDRGDTWSASNTPLTTIWWGSVAFQDPLRGLLVEDASLSPTGAAYRTTDGGLTWGTATPAGLAVLGLRALTPPGGICFAHGSPGWVAYTRDLGTSWGRSPTGIVSGVTAIDGASQYVWATGARGEILRASLEFFITGVEDDNSTAQDFRLDQNYPNPFNGETRIRFSIAGGRSPEPTTLRIFDLLGRAVAAPVAEPLRGGTHTIVFKTGDLPSGTYFYRLQSAGMVRTRSMQILR